MAFVVSDGNRVNAGLYLIHCFAIDSEKHRFLDQPKHGVYLTPETQFYTFEPAASRPGYLRQEL
jgi:hypothetical protein